MKNASEQLSNIFKSINKVKKTLRSKKYCYEDCKSEEIRKMFLIVLQSDLFLLRSSLDDWIGAGCPMEETRKELEAMKQPVERLHKLLNTCTDISDFNEVDGFKCSNCGIEITDFCRVERDEDDGSESYHEFILKYCPNCGRFIKRDE